MAGTLGQEEACLTLIALRCVFGIGEDAVGSGDGVTEIVRTVKARILAFRTDPIIFKGLAYSFFAHIESYSALIVCTLARFGLKVLAV